MSLRIERRPWERLGIGRTPFKAKIELKDDTDPNIPGTNIPRIRPVALGARAVGFFGDEVDRVIEAFRALRDASPAIPRKPALAPKHQHRGAAPAKERRAGNSPKEIKRAGRMPGN